VLGLDVRRVEESSMPGRRTLTGCVQITGTWEGAVTLDCSAALARRVAGIMFGVSPEHAESGEIQDALGEMTNMTGGNIKNLLPSPSLLSLPSVTEGLDYTVSVPGGRLIGQVAFDCLGEPLRVSLLERDDDRRDAR
jgi:chemotaxis protein CheX